MFIKTPAKASKHAFRDQFFFKLKRKGTASSPDPSTSREGVRRLRSQPKLAAILIRPVPRGHFPAGHISSDISPPFSASIRHFPALSLGNVLSGNQLRSVVGVRDGQQFCRPKTKVAKCLMTPYHPHFPPLLIATRGGPSPSRYATGGGCPRGICPARNVWLPTKRPPGSPTMVLSRGVSSVF